MAYQFRGGLLGIPTVKSICLSESCESSYESFDVKLYLRIIVYNKRIVYQKLILSFYLSDVCGIEDTQYEPFCELRQQWITCTNQIIQVTIIGGVSLKKVS